MHWTGTKKLGDYGEHELAPKLLQRIGLDPLVDLNRKVQQQFPWADFCGKKEGQWWMINVKTRLKQQKPDRNGKISLNSSYNSSSKSLKNYLNAINILKQNNFVDCKPMWLAIAMEVDQTFDAYWGEAKEMKHFMEPNIYWGILMGKKYTKIYRTENRIIANKERHDFDWTLYPDNWTYEAHLKWRTEKAVQLLGL